MTDTRTVASYDVEPADGGEIFSVALPTHGQVQLEVIDGEADAQVFLTPAEARRLAVQLLLFAEALEG